MDDSTAVDKALLTQAFPGKSEEKIESWVEVLTKEEFTTVGDLRSASDDAWKELNLPVAVRDTLRRFVTPAASAPPTTAPAPAPAPAPAAVPKAASPPSGSASGSESGSDSGSDSGKRRKKAKGKSSTPTTAAAAATTGERKITQVDAILFDVSGSMSGRSFDRDKTRAEVGKILFQAFIDKIVGAELSHAICLITFGQDVKFRKFTRDCTALEGALGELSTNEGSTRLWDAIDEACTQIKRYSENHSGELAPDCAYRVFCLTDGEDTASGKRHWEVAARLVRHGYILDAFPLADPNKWFQSMAASTGGLCLTVSDTAAGIGLFEREAVLQVSCRDPPIIKPVAPRGPEDLQKLFDTEAAKGVTDVKASIPKAALAPVLCGAYEVARASKSASSTGSKRVFKEFRDLIQSPVPLVLSAFINADDCFFWKVIMEGPAGTPYEGRRWVLSVQFPRNYPEKAPTVKFLVPIYHINVSNDGRICLDVLGNSWNANLSITRVLASIRTLMQHPNNDDPLDTYKATVFKDDRERYIREAREHSRQFASRSVDELKQLFKIDA